MTGLTFTIASSIMLAQAVLSQGVITERNQCPNGWGSTQFNNNDVHCCYGSITVNNNEGFCCVHGSGGSSAIEIDVGDCFPFCSELANRNTQIASPSQKCIDNVPFSAVDYSQRVSAASKLAVASQTGGSPISSNSASATKSAAVTQMIGSQTGSNGASSSNGASATKSGSSSGAMGTAASTSGSKGSSASIVITNAASSVTHGLVQVGGIVAVAVMLAI